MRILYHHRTASRDGQSTHIEEMIRALRGLGHEVAVAAPNVEDSSQSGGSPGWAGRLKRALPRPLYEIMELTYSVIAYRRLKQAIRAFQPAGIYERYNLFLVAGVWARARFGLPLVLEVNGPVALERRIYGGLSLAWLADRVEHYVWRHADVVLPVTQVLAEHIIAQGVPRERVVVIPNGVNVADYSAIPSTDEAKIRLGLGGRLVIGFTGFVREWDRLDRIVRWLAAHPGPERTHLLVVGDGPARAEIEACAEASGVSDRVTFTGVIRRDVWGPPGSYIEGNNELGLALITTIPLMRFLQMQLKSRWVKHALTLLMVLSATAALGTQSRGALLAIIAMSVMVWLRGGSKVLVGAMTVLVAAVLLAFMPEQWGTRMSTISEYQQDPSAMGRINAWWMAWNLAKNRFFGAGFAANEPDIFALYAPNPGDVHAAHSIYFQVLGEHGFVGLAVFLLIWALVWWSAGWLRRNATKQPESVWAANLGAMCQASLLAYLVGGAFLSLAYFDLPYNLLVLVVVARRWVEERGWERDGAASLEKDARPLSSATQS